MYFERRYGIGPAAIGLVLLGYGMPGFLFGPLISRAADRWGRAKLLPIGLALSGIAAVALMVGIPLIFAPVVAMILSLSYDMTQSLFAVLSPRLAASVPGRRWT